jgi:heat shock protein HslJ
MKRIARLPTVLLLLTTVASGCEDLGPSAGGALAGSRWRLAEWSVSSLQPSDFTITATFDDSGIVGTSAVNIYRGTYSGSNGRLSIRDISSTEIAGPEPAMRAERIYVQLLRDARNFDRSAESLVLKGEGGNELLRFTPVK